MLTLLSLRSWVTPAIVVYVNVELLGRNYAKI